MAEVTWWGERLPLADYAYNTTLLNERAVELPVVWAWMRPELRTLELGNVLGHYPGAPERTVVDRYEVAPGVQNIDVFDLTGTYEQIVAISTVEHIRWDEPGQREPGGSQVAVEHLLSLLARGGRLLVTVPTGHNAPLDEWLMDGAGTTRCCTLVRTGSGQWVQTASPVTLPYGTVTKWAESVWIGEWTE